MRASTQLTFDPLPRSIAVLVAGHRGHPPGAPAAHRETGAAAFSTLDAVLEHCARLCKSPAETDELFPPLLYRSGDVSIRVLTGQAEGIEQHTIRVAQELGLPVDLLVPDTVLPDYRTGCARTVAFGCPQETLRTEDTAFAMRDELALSYADVLVAVWDGESPRGENGGVARLVQRAVLAGLPVLWIDLTGRCHTVDAKRLTEEFQYRLRGPVPERGLLRGLFVHCHHEAGILIEALRQRLNPLDRTRVVQNEESELLAHYARERHGLTPIDCRAGSIQEFMSALFRLNRPAMVRSIRKMLLGAPMTAYFGPAGHDPLGDAAGQQPGTGPSIEEPSARPIGLRARFAWCDVRANMAGGKHRSSIWLLYVLSSLAVVAAVAGVLGIGPQGSGIELLWPASEALCIFVIVSTVLWSRRNRWHRCWLGHRFIAEQIRYLVMMQPFLATPAPFRDPLFVRTDAPHKGHVLASAELWLIQRTLSSEGLPQRYSGYELASAAPATLARYLRRVIRHQSAFHKSTRKRAEEIHEHMHWTANGLFYLAVTGVALHFLLHWLDVNNPTWLLLLTASCPAIAAALHGIATKLEIARIAAQSQRVRSRLVTMALTVSRAVRLAGPGDWTAMVRLRADALEAASLLSHENEQWRDLIRYQITEIPA